LASRAHGRLAIGLELAVVSADQARPGHLIRTRARAVQVNRLALLCLCLCLALGCDMASAQGPQSPCSYDACALRVVDGGGYFATQVVVRGREGYSLAMARRSATLDSVFAVNDSSAAYYARFETNERYADWFGWIGTGLMLSGFIADLAGEGGLFSRTFLLYGGGLAVTYGVALPFQRRASTDLSNAIWWYNRSLLR
jgi:hypothetical protein